MLILLIQHAQIISNQCEPETTKKYKEERHSDSEIPSLGFFMVFSDEMKIFILRRPLALN